MGWLAPILMIAFYALGKYLSTQAWNYLKDPSRPRSENPLFNPDEYRPEGERFRLRAIRFWWGGGVALAVTLFLIWRFQRTDAATAAPPNVR